nr:hypothetical protein [uncultured Noviherbaspirillum sp.]
MTNKRLYATASALLLTLALGACGGSDNNDNGGNGGGSGASAGASDSFFTQVLALIGSSPDNTEPVPIDSYTATTPETIEPAAL